jgi:hypothetical protein
MAEGGHLGQAVEHEQTDGQANDGEGEQVASTCPQKAEPPADKQKVDGTDDEGAGWGFDVFALVAIFVADECPRPCFERQDLGDAVNHPQTDGQADDGEVEKPCDKNPPASDVPADEKKPDDTQNKRYLAYWFDGEGWAFFGHDSFLLPDVCLKCDAP